MKETELYEPVKAWLENRGYLVYPEVLSKNGKRADIVGLKEDSSVIVEMKTSLSIELISQGVEWDGRAHQVYLAVPNPMKGVHWYASKIIRQEGLGLLLVNGYPACQEYIKPVTRPASKDIRGAIHELHAMSDLQGGHSGGGYVTPYTTTIHYVKEYLKTKEDWITIKDIVENCKTHYRGNAKQSLTKSLKEFESSWCDTKLMGGKLYFKHKKV